MRLTKLLTVLATAALLTACLPESKNPLSTPSTSRIDPRLEGAYAPSKTDEDNKKHERSYWHFHYRGITSNTDAPARTTPWLEILTVESSKGTGLKTHRYQALTTRLGAHDYLSYLDLPDSQERAERSETTRKASPREDGGVFGGKHSTTKNQAPRTPYSFARYEVTWRGDLRIYLADNTAFATAIKSGKIRGKVTKQKYSDKVEITDTPAHLAAFIAASSPKALFSDKPMTLRKIAHY